MIYENILAMYLSPATATSLIKKDHDDHKAIIDMIDRLKGVDADLDQMLETIKA